MERREARPSVRIVPPDYEMDFGRAPEHLRLILIELSQIPTGEERTFEEIRGDIDTLAGRVKKGWNSFVELDGLGEALERVVRDEKNFPSGMLRSKIGLFVESLLGVSKAGGAGDT